MLPEIRDIQGPVDYPTPFPFVWIAIVVLLCVVILGIWMWRRKKSAIHQPADFLGPVDKALKSLTLLAKSTKDFVQNSDLVYSKLSQIVRHYVEERFGIRAPEMTTEEFLHHLKTTDVLSQQHKELLEKFLTSCDMVKFAKYAPGIEEVNASFECARDFVIATRPQQQQEQGA